MATWTATRGTDSITFNGSPYKLISIEGVGGAPTRRIEERGPLQDGVTDLGYRLEPRVISMVIWIQATTAALLDGYRDTLQEFFKPKSTTPIMLKVTRDDGGVRQIDGYASGIVEAPKTIGENPLGKAQKIGVQIRCPNPIWYDPTPTATAFVASLSEWRYGGGLIGTSNLKASTESPAAGSVSTVGTLSNWTIFTRTARPTSGTQVLYYANVSPSYEMHFRAAGSVNAVWSFSGINLQGTAFTSGTAALFFTRENTELRFLKGSAQLLGITSVYPSTLDGAVTWRSNGGEGGIGSAWVPTITHAAVYDIALSAEQRTGVINAIDHQIGYFSGTVTMTGNWDEYPVITLTGPFNDPVITNYGTSEVLDFTGSTIAAGDIYIIDTRYGHKSVLTQAGANIIGNLSNDSDIASFHFVPGNNFLQVSFTGGTSAISAVNVAYYNRYIAP